jgi:hypothetical protein
MCVAVAMAATAVAGAVSAYGQYQSGVAQNAYYQYSANQKTQEATYDLNMGQKQSELIQDQAQIQGKQLATSQAETNASAIATEAAHGISGSGTAEDIAKSNLTKEQLDQTMLHYNADIKGWSTIEDAKGAAWTATNEATQDRFAGANAKRAGAIGATGTLLGTASSVAGLGYKAGLPGQNFSYANLSKNLLV